MSTKRTITACWLLVVYLVMTVGPAWASLSCRCMAHRAAAEEVAHCCVHHHHAHSDHAAAHAACTACDVLEHAPAWSARCCGDRHSTEIELYTGADDDRNDRIAAPASLLLAPECTPAAAPAQSACLRFRDPSPGPRCHGFVRCAGAHAPPVRG